MSKEDLKSFILAAMSVGGSVPFKPVQVQKLFFLIDQKLAPQIGGPFFNFKPYDYGPYDSEVFALLEELRKEGHVEISLDGRFWSKRSYRLTPTGVTLGQNIINKYYKAYQSFLKELVDFVQKLSFTELVSAIYKAYPEMRKNSVFQGE